MRLLWVWKKAEIKISNKHESHIKKLIVFPTTTKTQKIYMRNMNSDNQIIIFGILLSCCCRHDCMIKNSSIYRKTLFYSRWLTTTSDVMHIMKCTRRVFISKLSWDWQLRMDNEGAVMRWSLESFKLLD